MSSVTGTQDGGPATPLVVPPRGAVSGAEITGTLANGPATPLVVPGRTVAARVAPATPAEPVAPVHHLKPPARTATRTPTQPHGTLAATGGSAAQPTLGVLFLGGLLWLRRRAAVATELQRSDT